MIGSFRGQWHRLGRSRVIAGTAGAMVALSALVAVLAFGRAGNRSASVDIGPIRGLPTLAELATADGVSAVMRTSSVMCGIVALALTAMAIGGDYASGMIRLWLVRHPARGSHLAGLTAAVLGVAWVAYTAATLVSLPLSIALAAWQDVDTSAWFTLGAAGELALTWLVGLMAIAAWVAIGVMLAVITRSSSMTITAMTTLVVVESMVSSAWRGAERWLPETTLANLAAGGSELQSQSTAFVLALIYGLIAIAIAQGQFRRADVSD